MSQSFCNVCAFESYNAALWATQNPWFRDYSSLAGALEEQPNQEVPSLELPPPFSGVLGWHQCHGTIPFNTFAEPMGQPSSAPVAQDVRLEPVLESSADSYYLGYDHSYGGWNYGGWDYDASEPEPLADLYGDHPIFCRVEDCRYWHTDHKQVKRHRNSHFCDRFGYLCPNQAGTCPSSGNFKRRDRVTAHCRRSPECDKALRANNGEIEQWGTLPNERDLVPYDPTFHKPYRSYDGRNGGC